MRRSLVTIYTALINSMLDLTCLHELLFMCLESHHGDVPGAYLLDVPHQVLPGEQALHVHVKRLPEHQHLLVASVQTGEVEGTQLAIGN